MGVTVGVTGHTKGFGKYIYSALPGVVKGYSRTNGYDICDPFFLREVDCIINNAEHGFGQLRIAIQAHMLNIYCINIGSLITDATVTDDLLVAKEAKIALRAFSDRVGQSYLTWGFLENHPIAQMNPQLIETITVNDAVKEVTDEYTRWRSLALI